MKKTHIGILVILIMMISGVAFAGMWSQYRSGEGFSLEEQKFFEETKDLRKAIHDKRFELMELYRTDGDKEKIAKLEKEIDEIRDKVHAKRAELGLGYGPGAGREGFGSGSCPGGVDQRAYASGPCGSRNGYGPGYCGGPGRGSYGPGFCDGPGRGGYGPGPCGNPGGNGPAPCGGPCYGR